MKFLLRGLIVSLALLAMSMSAHAFKSFQKFPSCTDEKVLERLIKQFNKTEDTYWEHRGLELSSIYKPHLQTEKYFRGSAIERRHCHARAVFSNGRKRQIYYRIEKNMGLAGFGWKLDYCVRGLDPLKYYDGRCRVLNR